MGKPQSWFAIRDRGKPWDIALGPEAQLVAHGGLPKPMNGAGRRWIFGMLRANHLLSLEMTACPRGW